MDSSEPYALSHPKDFITIYKDLITNYKSDSKVKIFACTW